MGEDATTDVFHRALADPPAAPAGFETTHRVRSGDVDQGKQLRLDSAARYLQDVAHDHLDATAFARTDPLWIVRRTVIDVIEPISWPGTVTLHRWCSALSTRWTNMRVRISAEHETNHLNPRPRAPAPAPRRSDRGRRVLESTSTTTGSRHASATKASTPLQK